MRFFINRSSDFDFDQARLSDPVEEITFNERQTTNREQVAFKQMDFKIVQNLVIAIETNQKGTETTTISQISLMGSVFNLADHPSIQDFELKKPITNNYDEHEYRSSTSSVASSALSAASIREVERSLKVKITELLLDKEPKVGLLIHPIKLQNAPDYLLNDIYSRMKQAFNRYDFPTGLLQEAEKSKIVIELLNGVIDSVEAANNAAGFFKLRSRVHFTVVLDGQMRNCYADHAIVTARTSRYCVLIECKTSNCDEGVKQLVAYMVKASEANKAIGCKDTIFGLSTIASDFSLLRYDGKSFKLSEQFRFLFSRMTNSEDYKAKWMKENCFVVHLLYTILTEKVKQIN